MCQELFIYKSGTSGDLKSNAWAHEMETKGKVGMRCYGKIWTLASVSPQGCTQKTTKGKIKVDEKKGNLTDQNRVETELGFW